MEDNLSSERIAQQLILISPQLNSKHQMTKIPSVMTLDIAGTSDPLWHQSLSTTLQSPDIWGNFLRHFVLRLVLNEAVYGSHPAGGSVTQDSVLGPLWH